MYVSNNGVKETFERMLRQFKKQEEEIRKKKKKLKKIWTIFNMKKEIDYDKKIVSLKFDNLEPKFIYCKLLSEIEINNIKKKEKLLKNIEDFKNV